MLFHDWGLWVKDFKIKLYPEVNIEDIELKNVIQHGHGVDNPGFEAKVSICQESQ